MKIEPSPQRSSQLEIPLDLKITPLPAARPEHDGCDYRFSSELDFGNGRKVFPVTTAVTVGKNFALVAATHKGPLLCIGDLVTWRVFEEKPATEALAKDLLRALACHVSKFVSEQRAVKFLNKLCSVAGVEPRFSLSNLPAAPVSFKGKSADRKHIIRAVREDPRRGIYHMRGKVRIGDVSVAVTGYKDEHNLLIYNCRTKRVIYSLCPSLGSDPGWDTVGLARSFWRRELILYGIAELEGAGIDMSKELARQRKLLTRKEKADNDWFYRRKSIPEY